MLTIINKRLFAKKFTLFVEKSKGIENTIDSFHVFSIVNVREIDTS